MEWLKNDEPLRSNAGERIESIGSYSGLKIHSINFADTGAYMCQASSIGGLARDISSLVVQDDSTPSRFPTSRPFPPFFCVFCVFFVSSSSCRSDRCALCVCYVMLRPRHRCSA